jgi:hypothetical protein
MSADFQGRSLFVQNTIKLMVLSLSWLSCVRDIKIVSTFKSIHEEKVTLSMYELTNKVTSSSHLGFVLIETERVINAKPVITGVRGPTALMKSFTSALPT